MRVPDLKIVNVVATASLGRYIDLESLAQSFPKEILHDSDVYGGRVAYYKSTDMEGKVSIFWSGKMISIGTRSAERAEKELELVAKILGADLKKKPSIRNIVATADFGSKIDLGRLASSRKLSAIYEPEQFPGMIVRMQLLNNKKVSFLIFASGKVVCTGLQRKSDLEEAVRLLSTNIADTKYSEV